MTDCPNCGKELKFIGNARPNIAPMVIAAAAPAVEGIAKSETGHELLGEKGAGGVVAKAGEAVLGKESGVGGILGGIGAAYGAAGRGAGRITSAASERIAKKIEGNPRKWRSKRIEKFVSCNPEVYHMSEQLLPHVVHLVHAKQSGNKTAKKDAEAVINKIAGAKTIPRGFTKAEMEDPMLLAKRISCISQVKTKKRKGKVSKRTGAFAVCRAKVNGRAKRFCMFCEKDIIPKTGNECPLCGYKLGRRHRRNPPTFKLFKCSGCGKMYKESA